MKLQTVITKRKANKEGLLTTQEYGGSKRAGGGEGPLKRRVVKWLKGNTTSG